MHAYNVSSSQRDLAMIPIRQLLEDAQILWANQCYADSAAPLTAALNLAESQLGLNDVCTADVLYRLGSLRRLQGKFDLASEAFERALSIRADQLGLTHSDTLEILIELANLYFEVSDYERSESYFLRAFLTHESLGRDDEATAQTLVGLARLLNYLARETEAEPLLRKALATQKRLLGEGHHETAKTAGILALLYDQQPDFKVDPEPLYRLAVTGEPESSIPEMIYRLADYLRRQGRIEEAEPLFDETIRWLTEPGRTSNVRTGWILGCCLQFLHDTGREEEAEEIEENIPQDNAYTEMLRNDVIHQERMFGAESVELAESLVSLAHYLVIFNHDLNEAETLLRRALKIRTATMAMDDPLVSEIHTDLELFAQHRKSFANAMREPKRTDTSWRPESEKFDAFTRPWLDDRRPYLIRAYLDAIINNYADETGAVMAITALTFMADLDDQWDLIRELVREAPDDDRVLQQIAAGPLEGMLGHFNEAAIDRVETKAAINPKFRRVVTGVWKHGMSDSVWARVRAIQAGVPNPLPESQPF